MGAQLKQTKEHVTVEWSWSSATRRLTQLTICLPQVLLLTNSCPFKRRRVQGLVAACQLQTAWWCPGYRQGGPYKYAVQQHRALAGPVPRHTT